MMKTWLLHVVLVFAAAVGAPVAAQDEPNRILITNVHVFDGVNEDLIEDANVLIEGNIIAAVTTDRIFEDGATVIDGDGRVLMPGLTDAHVHIMIQDAPQPVLLSAGLDYVAIVGAQAAHDTLMRGFTTVRDLGGPSFGLKRAIDQGLIAGPRIYPSGAMIGQTSGHSDFRSRLEIPAEAGVLTPLERAGFVVIADGVPEVRKRTREVLRAGASQIKVMAGGGVASDFDPLDVRQYSREELEAAVEAADAWNTYVTVHAYTPKAVRAAVEAGVQCVEHGQMIDEDTAELLAERDIWLSLQPFLDDEDASPLPEGSANRAKQLQMMRGTDAAYRLAIEYDLKVAFGTDMLFSKANAMRQGAHLAKLERWYEPWEVLKMATSENYALFKLSGPRDPYPLPNGVIVDGAYADLILVDGNPLEDLELIADPHANFDLIMKDGVIYKDTIGD